MTGEKNGSPPERVIVGPTEGRIFKLAQGIQRRRMLSGGKEPTPEAVQIQLAQTLAGALDRLEFRILQLAGEEPTIVDQTKPADPEEKPGEDAGG